MPSLPLDLTGNIIKADSVTLTPAGRSIIFGSGAPGAVAIKGTLYINTAGSSSSTRMYVNNGGSAWVAFTTAS